MTVFSLAVVVWAPRPLDGAMGRGPREVDLMAVYVTKQMVNLEVLRAVLRGRCGVVAGSVLKTQS